MRKGKNQRKIIKTAMKIQYFLKNDYFAVKNKGTGQE